MNTLTVFKCVATLKEGDLVALQAPDGRYAAAVVVSVKKPRYDYLNMKVGIRYSKMKQTGEITSFTDHVLVLGLNDMLPILIEMEGPL